MPIPTLDQFFSLREYSYQYLCDGFKITVVTDVNCHLFLRYTLVKPQTHIVPRAIRGISLPGELYFCFVSYEDNEQEEAGDTLIHTFYKRNWPVCETRWFYFWGTHAALPMRSTTALFRLHFDIVQHSIIGQSNNRTIRQRNAVWDTAHDAPAGTVHTFYQAPWYYMNAGSFLTATFHIDRGFLSFYTGGLPTTDPPGGAFLRLFVIVKYIQFLTYPRLYITKGVQHTPVIPTDYGDQLPITDVLGEIDLRDIVVNAFNDIPLNDAGLAHINLSGTTKLCLRSEMDVADINTGVLYNNWIAFNTQQKGVDYAPKLIVCLPPL